jgi:hypothetical protein
MKVSVITTSSTVRTEHFQGDMLTIPTINRGMIFLCPPLVHGANIRVIITSLAVSVEEIDECTLVKTESGSIYQIKILPEDAQVFAVSPISAVN